MKRRFLVFVAVCGVVFISANKIFTPKNILKFSVPKGWTQPIYDFKKNPVSKEGFTLGRILFYDPVLSRDSSTSCASCHLSFTAFTHVDHRVSHGINGLQGTRNSIALQNLAWQNSFMWDGGVNNLEVQPLAPIQSAVEMDNKLDKIVTKLNTISAYRKLFQDAFGDSVITGQHVLKALAQFTVMLKSDNSKYDKVMRGEKYYSFTTSEQSGLNLFRKNCSGCHAEPLFTDNSFRNNGMAYDTFYRDAGREKITKNISDSMKFRVPSLRNISASFPYMHDGRFATLNDVLEHYSQINSQTNPSVDSLLKNGIQFSDSEKKDMLSFLKTLTDTSFIYNMDYRYLRY